MVIALSACFGHAGTSFVREHVILGRNEWDAERQRDLWLAQYPAIRIVKVHPPKGERNLLTRLGGQNVPRVSITVEYEHPELPQEQDPS
jgi:hypothetical protein